MDGDTVELWRSLGRSTIGTRVLKCLAEKLNRVGNNCLQDEDSACERHSRRAALEAVTITHAISEVVLALGSTEELKRLLPHLLPSLLRWASETLGEERSLSPLSTWRELFLECGIAEEKPCRLFLVALEKVLGRCLADKWMRLLTNQAAWALLENPLCHPDGVTLLTSVLLRAELVSPCLMKNLSAWLDSRSAKLWVTAEAFFAECRPEHPEDGGREKETVPVAVTALEVVGTLLKHLQDHEGDRVEIYRELESVLQGDDGRLPGGIVNRLIAEASSDMRAAQGVTDDMKTAASDVLVALARSHFHFVMSELQRHLKAMGKVPEEFVLLTLGKLSRSYALQCIPFVGMTLLALRAMLSQVGSGRILRTFCSVVEQWSKGVTAYFCSREQCPFPRSREARLCRDIYPVFRYVVANLLHCEEEEDKQAVLGAVTAMTVALLHGEQHGYHAWEPFLWLLQQYQEVRDTSQVTKNLSYLLETLEGLQSPIPQGLALAISSAVYCQALFLRLCDVTKEPGLGRKAVLSRCIVLLGKERRLGDAPLCRGSSVPVLSSWRQLPANAERDFFSAARTYPEETIAFLRCQLSSRSNAYRVAALGLLRELARSDDPATREQLPQLVEAVRSVCSNPSAQVQTAVVEFIRELLSSGSQSCQEWDVVGHIFNEFGRISGRLVAEGHLAWENPEEQALQALCMEIVGSLDISLRGMTKLLWPRLLEYVVPAQYSGMLIPLSRCLRALVERQERAGHEEEEKPDAVNSKEQDGSPGECRWVLAAAPEKTGERAAAALRLLQALHGRIHRAVAAVWATEMPPLLQYLEGTTEDSLDSADWEERMLKFLRASLEPIEDGAWTVGLSQELSQQLGSSVPGSWEKLFLYKALGTALAACRDLGHVRGEVLRFLQEANPMELPEAQGMISVVSRAAENHFHLVLDTVTMFSSAFTGDWLCQTSTGWKVQQQQNKERAQATCAALMHTYSSIALCAPKEQLLACVEKEIVGNILQLCGARERDWQLKLALVQSITEVSSAIQAVGDCGSFELGLKQKVMWTLLQAEATSEPGGQSEAAGSVLPQCRVLSA
ncbi:maestro heat-like repeat-containing protein family member 2B [Opisthocomus hoazin]|uniref:maestro heat-like repeat-containing protein family member 2B n=1 Tax=Opisthocomus hoazin TaxID=30419 RepID=UPI003F532128